MYSPKLWIYNYDFEFELAQLHRVRLLGKHLSPWYFLNRASTLFLPFTTVEDAILIQQLPDERILSHLEKRVGFLPAFKAIESGFDESNSLILDFLEKEHCAAELSHYQYCPWGWGATLNRLKKNNPSRPSFNTIKYCNSKAYSNHVRNELLAKSCRFGSKTITDSRLSPLQLQAKILKFHEHYPRFFIKNFYGTSGNLSDYCSSNHYSPKKLKQWCLWILQKQGILLEEYIQPAEEISIQVIIDEQGYITPLTATQLISANNGSYVGNILSKETDILMEQLYPKFSIVFENLAKSGYFGPVGIDILRSKDNYYKLIEINARITMGRVAYEWNRLMNHREVGLFANFFWNNDHKKGLTELMQNLCFLERQHNCDITIINSVHSKIKKKSLITIFIAANTKNCAVKTVQKIKPSLFQ